MASFFLLRSSFFKLRSNGLLSTPHPGRTDSIPERHQRHRTVSPRTTRNTCVYTRHPCTMSTAKCGVLTRLPAKLAKNGMRVKTSAGRQVEKQIAGFKLASMQKPRIHTEDTPLSNCCLHSCVDSVFQTTPSLQCGDSSMTHYRAED